jgi:hypothetical protein
VKDFEIINLQESKYAALVIMKTHMAPLQYMSEIAESLAHMKIKGLILIDELMHSGNNEDRFIVTNFNGDKFDRTSMAFAKIEKRSEIRRISCEYLSKELDMIEYSILSNNQKEMICRGLYI